jgi:voltage-gated potassium channel
MNRLKRWERRTEAPLLVLAALFAAAYVTPILLPHAEPDVKQAAQWVEWAVWAAFAADYGVRLTLAENRWRFVRSEPLTLAAVVLPLLQPLRLLRLVSAALLVGQRVRMAAQVRLTTYIVGSVMGLALFGSLAVLEIERKAPDGNIHTLGDALWWSFTTMTTVGYGDHAPTTGLGRMLAVGLMLSGIALIGVVTANIATWFIARFEAEERAEERRTHQMVGELLAEVRELRREVAALKAPAVENDGGAPLV